MFWYQRCQWLHSAHIYLWLLPHVPHWPANASAPGGLGLSEASSLPGETLLELTSVTTTGRGTWRTLQNFSQTGSDTQILCVGFLWRIHEWVTELKKEVELSRLVTRVTLDTSKIKSGGAHLGKEFIKIPTILIWVGVGHSLEKHPCRPRRLWACRQSLFHADKEDSQDICKETWYQLTQPLCLHCPAKDTLWQSRDTGFLKTHLSKRPMVLFLQDKHPVWSN